VELVLVLFAELVLVLVLELVMVLFGELVLVLVLALVMALVAVSGWVRFLVLFLVRG